MENAPITTPTSPTIESIKQNMDEMYKAIHYLFDNKEQIEKLINQMSNKEKEDNEELIVGLLNTEDNLRDWGKELYFDVETAE